MDVNFTVLDQCRACESTALKDVIDFGNTAIADDYFELRDNTSTYPLVACLCEQCGLLQLRHVVDPSAIYDDYIYYTSSSPGLKQHFASYAQSVHHILALDNTATVLDIGCNDGVLLKEFEKLGCNVAGVEPSEHTTEALRKGGMKVICGYWDHETRVKVTNEVGKLDVITANNVFANVNDIKSFTQNVASSLSQNGCFIVETGSHHSLIKNFVFDNIYHEHLTYFSVHALNQFFRQFGMEIFNVEKMPTKGGSIRVYAGFTGCHDIAQHVGDVIEDEKQFGLFSAETYTGYMARITTLKHNVHRHLEKLKSEGVKLIGFGASATCTTVLYALDIARYLSCLVDDNEVKQNTYSPGFRLPVKSSEILLQEEGSCVVILPWRFAEMFIAKNTSHLDRNGIFMKIMPDVEIVRKLTS